MKLLATCLALGISAAAASRVLHERVSSVPVEWEAKRRSPRDVKIELTVAVKQSNRDALERHFFEVSDPDHARYGQHLSHDEVQQLVMPEPRSILAALGWLHSEGVDEDSLSASSNSDFIHAVVPVAVAERLLDAPFFEFEHRETGDVAHRVGSSYTLPDDVSEHVDFVAPTVRFPATSRLHVETPARASPLLRGLEVQQQQYGQVTPTSLRKLYNVGDVQASSPDNIQAVAQYLKQYYSPSDLKSFFSQYYTPAEGRTVRQVIGPNKPGQPGVEASLDIEYIMAMGANVSTVFWSTPGNAPDNPQNEPFLAFLTALSNDTKPPLVVSTSYGDNEDSVSYQYASRINAEFQKAGARGISLLFSSGDGGVSGGQSQQCTKFVPTFPAGSPYVTAVGGSTGSGPETAAGLSSGGFSNYWDRPAFQQPFVKTYKSTASGIPDSSLFNHTGNGFPDVSAQAENFGVVTSGFPMPVSGTSCSSPTFSGIVSLLNDLRLQAGRPPLGFLNTLFYKNPHAFNDITSGSNPGCGTNGFPAAKGWDPVTGLGTPDYQKLAKVVQSN